MTKIENLDEITSLAIQAGKIVCESSGETYRAEDTIAIVGRSLGADRVEPYVTPTGITVYAEYQDAHGLQRASQAMRIKKRSTNLGKITAINALSRQIALSEDNDYTELANKIENISNLKSYNNFFSIFIAALSGFVFTLLFAGSLTDAIASAFIGAVMRVVLFLITPLRVSGFITTVIGGSVVSFLAGIFVYLGLDINFGTVNVGTLMYLMPGMAIVIAIRDIIGGDYVSGMARAMEAFVVALSLSVGAATGLLLFPSAINYNTSVPLLREPLGAFFFAATASATFSFVFEVKNKFHIALAFIAGGVSWLFYILLINNGVSTIQACFLGSFSAGLIAEAFALIFKAPSTVFLIPALISFVPGGGMYTTMHNMVLGKTSDGMNSLFSTLSVAGAIALAIAIATGGARLVSSFRRKSVIQKTK